MGKYSLESYEKYQEKKCRMAVLPKEARQGKMADLFEVKPNTDSFSLPDFSKPNTIWLLKLDFRECNLELMEQAVSFYKRQPFGGTVLTLPHMEKDHNSLLIHLCQQLSPMIPLAESTNPEMAKQMMDMGIPFGLLLYLEDSLIPVREFLAAGQLQRIWKKAPVYALAHHLKNPDMALDACRKWHVCASNSFRLSGPQLVPRRVTWPCTVTAGGVLPIRFWWENCGTSPLYGASRVSLLLKGAKQAEIPLDDIRNVWLPGDSTYNEIVPLPPLPPGQYLIYCRVAGEGHVHVPLASSVDQENGWYPLDTIELDETPRPELLTIWQDYYPEGYYPLEDPKKPGS